MFETPKGVIKPIVYVGIVRGSELLMVDYVNAPNPDKQGWWIPAPGLEFGGDPRATALKTVQEFGFTSQDIALHDVESFVSPGGWHLIYHFRCQVKGEPTTHANVREYRWVDDKRLSDIPMAHGRWEVSIGQSFLDSSL